jgi:hypothetical protein
MQFCKVVPMHNAMNTYGVVCGIALHWMQVSGQLQALAALSPGIRGWVSPGASLEVVELRKVSCVCRELNQLPRPQGAAISTEIPAFQYGSLGTKN